MEFKEGQQVRLKWIDGEVREDAQIAGVLAEGAILVAFEDEPDDPYEFEPGRGQESEHVAPSPGVYFEVNNSTDPVTIEPVS